MANFGKLQLWSEDGLAHVVVETPRGSRTKIAYDPELECFKMSRPLLTGLAYPYDWGFLPSTLAEDGDPVDALVIHDAPTFPGLVIRCRVVGVLKAQQKLQGRTERNDRIMAVPDKDRLAGSLKDIRSLPKTVLQEMEQFFCASVVTEDKTLEFLGWAGPKEALKLIKAGEATFRKSNT